MLDLVYVLLTVAFFALMLWYIARLRAVRAFQRRTRRGAPLMTPESVLGLLVGIAVLVYLLYALLRPEKF